LKRVLYGPFVFGKYFVDLLTNNKV